jgi:hypothetical protein
MQAEEPVRQRADDRSVQHRDQRDGRSETEDLYVRVKFPRPSREKL